MKTATDGTILPAFMTIACRRAAGDPEGCSGTAVDCIYPAVPAANAAAASEG